MQIIRFKIPGPFIIKPKILKDSRGIFFEKYRQEIIDSYLGHKIKFVQENQSTSKKNVFRGFHFQISPYAQSKLVSVSRGKILDIIIDIRKNSKYFGKHLKVYLDSFYHNSLFVPKGFAHGFVSLEDSIFVYKCSNFYDKESEISINPLDKDWNINWNIDNPTISEKDIIGLSLKDFITPF